MQMNIVYLLLLSLYALSVNRVSTSDILNNTCKLDDDRQGKCLHFKECESAIKQVQKRLDHPKICEFDKLNPIVCCDLDNDANSTVDTTKVGSISAQKCSEVYKGLPPDSRPISKIIGYGGVDSESRKFTHMAALGYRGDGNQNVWLCGGSLISDKHVLTAAHCVISSFYGNVSLVRLGDLNLNETDDDAEPEDFGIKRVLLHPNYKPPQVYDDIAIIELDRKTKFSDYVRPACLNTEHDINETRLGATGWGVTTFAGLPADHLQLMLLNPFSREDCETAYKEITKRRLSHGIDHDKQLCAGHNSMDTCQGDSGGPLQMRNQFKTGYTLIGVTSYGKPCGLTKSPGVYTRVSHYIKWIESIVWPDSSNSM